MYNETILINNPYNLTTLDIGQKASTCLHNGALNDKCLYNILCKPLDNYFINIAFVLLALELINGIVQFFIIKKFVKDKIKYLEICWKMENLTKFAFIIYIIVFIYYNI